MSSGSESNTEVNTSDSSCLSDFSQLPVLPKKKIKHPKFDPKKIWCDYCKQNGHSLDFCADRLKMNQKVAAQWCTKGYHSPKLHDDRRVWRCKFCAMHLHEEYVWEVYPNECAAEEEKFFKHRLQVEKYMA